MCPPPRAPPTSPRVGRLFGRPTPLVVVTRTDEEAHRLADDLAAWIGASAVRILPERAALPLERALPEHDESTERLAVLGELGAAAAGSCSWRRCWRSSSARWRLTSWRPPGSTSRSASGSRSATLLERLVAGGYEPSVEVTGIGEFAHRGGLIDAWPPGADGPVRIELFGDEVESIRAFDAMTQGSRRRLERVQLLPASEFLPGRGMERARRTGACRAERAAPGRPGPP